MDKSTDEFQHVDIFDRQAWTEDQKRYFSIVDEADAKSKSMKIGNGDAKHAAYLIGKFLRRARAKVYLLSGELIRHVEIDQKQVSVYANPTVVRAAQEFLERPKTQLSILLQKRIDADNKDPRQHPLIAAVVKSREERKLKGTLEVRLIPEKTLALLNERDFLLHWMTADDAAYRLEIDPNDHRAVANFNDGKATKVLADLFDRVVQRSPDLLLSLQPLPAS